MLSRSSLSIRNFIPHRRPSISDEDMSGAESKNEDSNGNIPRSMKDQDGGNNTHAAAAAPKRRSSRKPRASAPVPFIATTPLTHYDILRPLPPLPSETPRSSGSLSDRCERHVECDCPLLNSRRRSPHYTTSPRKRSEDSTPILLDANSCGADDSLTSRIPKSRFYLSRNSKSKEDVDPARPLSSGTEHKEERSEDKEANEKSVSGLLEDVQQFMQETEDAFKAIGTAISEVRPVQSIIIDTKRRSTSETASESDSTPPTPPPKELPASNDSPASLSKSLPTRMSSVFDSSPESSPNIGFSSQVPRQRKSKKSGRTRSMRPQRKPAALKQAVKSGPRWTLTENVSELLTGKLFHLHRIQADEMLTPDEIEAYKQLREKKLQEEKEAEMLETDVADTPVEPFHLDDLPSRIGSAGVKTNAEESTENPSIVFSEDVVQRNFSFERQRKNSISSSPPERPSTTARSFNQPNTFPMPSPSKPVSRHLRSASRGKVTELPIIPEACATTEFVYLRASPHSLTTPRFRHGPIRLSQADLVPDVKLGDEGLDWTAFQMAILGGAGDWFTDSDDTIRRRDAEEIADIAEWWGSWNFRSTGELITKPYEAPSPTSTLSGDEIPDISYTEIKMDNPYQPHHPWRRASRKSGADSLQLNLDFAKRAPSFYMDAQSMDAQWRLDSEQKQVVNRDSVGSLPPSPMLDLRVRSEDGDDFDVVPMGYNLGHDLGDFLKWEAEHAYAGDFNSPA